MFARGPITFAVIFGLAYYYNFPDHPWYLYLATYVFGGWVMYPGMGVLLRLQAAVAEVAVGAIDDICVELRCMRMIKQRRNSAQATATARQAPHAGTTARLSGSRSTAHDCTVYVEVVNSFAVSLVLMSAIMMAVGVLFLYTRWYNNPECAGKCGYMGLHA
jgi:hypothetical protein